MGIGLALTLTGNMSWGEFAMSAAGAIPGAGKGAQLAKLGMKGVGKNAAKELAERARPSRYICRGAEPVDMATGAMVDDFVDLTIGGELPLIVERKAVSSFGLGTAFGPSWASLFDCRVEVDADGIALVNVDGSVLWYDRPDPDAVGEVMPRVGTMPLSFVDGAYRVRNVAAGVTYEFSVVGDEGSVRMTADEPHQDEVPRDSVLAVGSVPVAGSSSLAGVADSAVVIGLSAVVSRTGHRFELVYDQQSGLVREVRHGGGAVVEVDTDAVTGRVLGLAVRDEVGVSTPVVSYRYDARANLAEVVNSSGVPMRFAYDDAARIVSWTDRNRVSYHYRYDDRGRVVRQVGTSGMFPNALVHLPDVGADAPVGGRIVVLVETVTDVLAEHERDERIEERLARLAQLPIVALLESGGLAGAGLTGRGRDGAVDSSVVEPGLVVAEELLVDEVLGRIQPWVYRSTAAGDVWRIVSAEGVVTEFEHDVHHNPTAFTGGDGARWETVFDEFGCEVATTDPQGRVSSIERGTWGMPARVTDEAGRVSEAVLDGFGSVVAVTDPVGAVTRFEHVVRASGVVTAARVDADGARTEFDYDAAGRVVRVIDPAQRVWSFERNVFGDVVAVTDPDGAVTSSEFTVEGWLLGQVYPDGTGVRLGYDAEGNQVEVVDEAGHVTRTEYTVFDHPRAVIDPSGGRVEIGYDSTMEQTWVRSPDGLSWRFERDRDARVVAETDYNGARSTFGLDGLGRPVVVTDALGHVRARRFDLLGRLVSEAATADGVTEYGYDVAGDLVSVVNGDARVEFERDGVGRVVAETVNGVVVRSRFDSVGRRTDREVTTGGRSWSATFGFDAAGRLAGIDAGGRFSTPEGRRIGFGYEGAGRESERRFGRSARLRQSFDRRGRLSRQHVLAGAERVAGGEQATGAQRLVAGRVWSYRADGYVTGVDDAVAGATRFDVDASGRVTAAVPSTVGGTRAAGTGAGGGEWFGYTPSGVLARADSGAGQPVGVAASPVAGVARVDGSDRVSRSGTLVTRVGRDRFTYDAAGRLRVRVRARLSRKAEVTEFSYTDGGQIREVGCGDGTRWRYGYDGLGRRVSKSHVDRDGRILDEVVFGWDGNDLVLQSNTALTPRGPVAAGASSTWVWTYHPDGGDVVSQEVVHHTPHTDTTPDKTTPDITPPDITPPVAYPAPDGHRGGVDGWSQGRVDTEFYAIVADLAGAPTELVDPLTGQVAGRAVRSVWGHTTWQGVSSPLGFAGQQHDPESGLFYNRFRFYNPATATYTSPTRWVWGPTRPAPPPTSTTHTSRSTHSGLRSTSRGRVISGRVRRSRVRMCGSATTYSTRPVSMSAAEPTSNE
ncbi:DUF6531 domain-containing protein [Gordonia sp. ABSL49_1]|uniref:DUF6531 domain-containing protein n=1 Tax=Gordonia sp. ABSL49_1 TaxID=2920941 RepID=UPI001F0E1FC1|nr:DUF6531 domain-containing protein [Gordonia sp. ABSL49_1]MCH5645681.1 DUF6531 domain-containing protein [Gordonia sp. ABSL49_1]